MEPTLLLPMGFGAILVNLPNSAAITEHGAIKMLFDFGIDNGELFPLLLFIGIGGRSSARARRSARWLKEVY